MDLKDLYRDVILDHNRSRAISGGSRPPTPQADGHNPLCGDRLTVFVRLDGERLEDIRFEGKGCAISTASASLMTRGRQGQGPHGRVDELFEQGARAADPARRGRGSRPSASSPRSLACASSRRA